VQEAVFGESRRNYFAPRMASFAALATRNFTTFLAGILISAPVAGAADTGLAVHEHELADAREREGVLRILVGELSERLEDGDCLLLEISAFSAREGRFGTW